MMNMFDIKKHRSRALWVLGICLLMLAAPSIAWAIPGAGELTSLDSSQGRQMAELYNLLAQICVVIFAIVCSVLIVAMVRFRRQSDDEQPEQTHGNLKIELGILIVASIVQVFIGWRTIEVMWFVEKMPEDIRLTVEARAYKWDWEFYYPATEENKKHFGITEAFQSEDLILPANVNVRILVTSKDIIHSLSVPELGIKMDAVPGRFNYWWVNADGPINQIVKDKSYKRVSPKSKPLKTTRTPELNGLFKALTFFPDAREATQVRGLERRVNYLSKSRPIEIQDGQPVSPYSKYDAVEYRGMCTELCGSGHYDMYFRAVAMTHGSFRQWIADMKSGANRGKVNGEALYNAKCASCHGDAGQGVPGTYPPLANSDYISKDDAETKQRHIKVVLAGLKGEIQVNGKTYNSVMQPWAGTFNDEEVAAVVNHERVSWGNTYGTVDAEMVAQVRAALNLPPYPAGGEIPIPEADLMAEGKKYYAACSTCHGESGRAAISGMPNIAGNPTVVSSPDKVVEMLVNGIPNKKSAMGRSMSNREIAALVSYLRKGFGNKGSVIQPGEVGKIRKDVTKK